jgi:hypothetical protein
MEILDLIWKFRIWYGNCGWDIEKMEITLLKFKFWLLPTHHKMKQESENNFQIFNSVSFLLRYLQPKSFQPYARKFGFWVRMSIFQIFRILTDVPSKLLTSLLYVFRPWVAELLKGRILGSRIPDIF